jgi:nucleotide-binding universal stress UspA family protein
MSLRPRRAALAEDIAVGADLIVMSSHGRKGVAAVLVGSETMKVLTHSKVPALVLR